MIRPVEQPDMPLLAELAASSFADTFGDTYSPERLTTELRENRSEAYFHRALKHDTILVDTESDRLFGYIQFGDPEWPDVNTEPGDQVIHRLYIATDHQGQGIGRRLLRAALDHPRVAAASQVWLQVWEHNPRAIHLYESFGFKMHGTTQYLAGTKGDELIMVKTLKDSAHAS
ncbi:MAG TPA: N-acetyltransferase [Candidatus Saccharimonadia bacterium]|jgi:ribosomal protein S18 acetylase RimI-like enzyme